MTIKTLQEALQMCAVDPEAEVKVMFDNCWWSLETVEFHNDVNTLLIRVNYDNPS